MPLTGQCWPAEALRVERLITELSCLNESERADRAEQLLTSFFGCDIVNAVVREDR